MFQNTPQKRVLFPRTLTPVMVGGFLAFLVLFSLLFSIFGAPKAMAATNGTLNFQARLENTSGNIAADGVYNVEFKLYNVSSGGASLWSETYRNSTSQGITVKNGYLSANLGSISAFPGNINWDQDLWVTLNIAGTSSAACGAPFTTPYGSNPCSPDGEMNPRLKLTAVPYAFKAGQLAQYNATSGFTSTLSLLQPTVGNQTFQVLDQTAAGTYTLCVQGATTALGGCAASTGGSGYIQNQSASAQSTSNFWISGNGTANTAFYAPLFDTPSGTTTLSIGTTNATQINLNQNVTVANNKLFTANGNAVFQANTPSATAFQVITATSNPLIVADTTTPNLVSNSSFEANITNWAAKVPTAGGGNSTLTQTSAQHYHGANSLQAITTAANYGVQTSTFTSAMTTATQYEVTFMARCSASIATFTYGRQDVSGGTANDINASTAATCDTNWRRYTFHFTTGGTVTTPNIYMTLGSTASGTLWVDAVQMLQTSTVGAQPYQAGGIKIGGVITDTVAIRSSSNSTSAFEVQDSTGVSNSLVVNTADNLVGIGGGLTVGSGNGTTNQVITSARVLQNVTADTGILTSGTLGVTRGGTGIDGSTAANGTLLIGNGSGYTLSTLTAGTGISINNASGSITISGTGAAGTASGDLTGSYPSPTIAKLQGGTLTITTAATNNILQYNGTAWVNQSISGDISLNSTGVATIATGAVTGTKIANTTITNTNLTSGTFGNITGTGALAAGSIASGFGTINNGSNSITTTGTLSGGTLSVGGTQRIDAAGNLVNIGNIAQSGTLSTTAVSAKGYVTSNTSNTNNGQYTRLGLCTLTVQYQACRSQATIVSTNDGGSLKRALIDIRVKQQQAMGLPPYVNLDVTDSSGFTASMFTAVITVNTAGTTTVELWGQINDQFQTWAISPIITAETTFTWQAAQGFSASLPTGTATVAAYAPVNGGAITANGDLTTTGNLVVGGQQVITSARVLQNVTANANILTTGTLSSTVVSGSYSGITGVGTLNGLSIATNNVFTNAGSTVNTAIALSNFSANGAIGTAAATVDVATSFTVNQTTSGVTLTIPSPTSTTAGRVIYISNIGSASFTLTASSASIIVSPNTSATLMWNGSTWTSAGIDGSGANYIQNTTSLQSSSNFWISGIGKADGGFDVGTAGPLLIGASSTANAITLGSTALAGTITLGQSTVANTINIGNAAVTGAQTVNIATAATGISGKAVVTIGSTNDGSSLTLQGGTSGVVVNSPFMTTNELNIGQPSNAAIFSRLFTDGFEAGDISMWLSATGPYAVGNGTAAAHNGRAYLQQSTTAQTAQLTTSITPNNTVVGRTYFNALTVGNPTYLEGFGYTNFTGWLYITLGTGGNICYTTNLSGTTTGTCSTTVPTTSTWHKLEAIVTVGNPTGTLQVYLDNTLISSLNLSGLNLGTTALDGFALGGNTATTATVNFDDVAVDTVATGDAASLNVNDSLHVSGTGSITALTVTGANGNGNSIEAMNGIDSNTGYSVGGKAGLSSNCTNGQGLRNTTVSGGIVTGGTCGNAASTLQDAYDNTSQTSGGTLSTPAFVRQVTATGSGTSVTASYPTITTGDLLVASVSTTVASGSTSTVTGITGAGGTWHPAVTGNSGTNNIQIWYCYNCNTTNTSIVASLSSTTTAALIHVSEYSGIQTSSDPLDTAAGGVGSTPNSGTQTSPSITTTRANDLVYAAENYKNVGTSTVSNPWQALTGILGAYSMKMYPDYQVNVPVGSYSATWTWSSGTGAAGVATVGFKATQTGGGTVASILLADAKDYVITAPDTTTDPNVLVNLQCRTGCSSSQGRWAIQSNGTDALSVLYDTGAAITNVNISSSATLKLGADVVGAAQSAITHDFTCTSSEQATDIVTFSATSGQAVRTTTVGNKQVLGVVVAKPTATTCTVAIDGLVQVKLTTADAGVGGYVQTSATSGSAQSLTQASYQSVTGISGTTGTATNVGQILGRELTARDVNGLIWLLIDRM